MDVKHITNIRSAIIGVMRGALGPVKVRNGVFEHGVFAELPIDKQKTLAKACKARHMFDVRFGSLSQHAASMVSNQGSEEIDTLAVEIQCWTHKRNSLPEFQRTATLDLIQADGNDARQALKASDAGGALATTIEGEETLIVSGIMLGPDATGTTPLQTDPQEDWENSLVRWSIVGSLILVVPQNEPIP